MSLDDPYYVELGETLIGRKAGESAMAKARELDLARRKKSFALFRKREDRSWRVGAVGEQRVARELARLPEGDWFLIHDIPIGKSGANVDHLAVGPGGAFSLNTKKLTGKVWVAERAFLHNGHRTDYLPKSRSEAERVARLLGAALGHPVRVRAILVVICDELTIKAQPVDVAVVARRLIRDWLVRQPRIFTTHEIIEIGTKASRPEVWRRS